MRLRRETGDWTIKFKGLELLTTKLPKGLSAEDFIGAVIEMDRTDTEESSVSHMQLTTANDVLGRAFSVACPLSKGVELYYDRRSGHLSLDPEDFEPTEDMRFTFRVVSLDMQASTYEIQPGTIDSGLTPDDFINATCVIDNDVRYYITSADQIGHDATANTYNIRYDMTQPGRYLIYDAGTGNVTFSVNGGGGAA